MRSWREKSLRRPGKKPSFAGSGLLERMRSTTFAILGITTAMCLGLVAIVAQQGLPVLPGLPLPGVAAEQGRVDEARAIAAPRPSPNLAAAASAARKASRSDGGRRPERSADSGLSGSRQLASAQDPVSVDPADGGGPSEEAPVAPAPVASPPAAAPAVAGASDSASPAPAVDGNSSGKATAAVDASEDDDEPPVVPGGGQAPSEAEIQAEVDADEVDSPPSQAEIDASGSRSGGRGHGYRRFGR